MENDGVWTPAQPQTFVASTANIADRFASVKRQENQGRAEAEIVFFRRTGRLWQEAKPEIG
jgi:hypothetical protein